MRCAVVFYFVATMFVVVYSVRELCRFQSYRVVNIHVRGKGAICSRGQAKIILDFIPPVSRNISYIELQRQPLKLLPYNAFQNVSSQRTLSAIWLNHCEITHINAGALLNLHELAIIVLAYNYITEIDSNFFSHTKQIAYISMRFNTIEVLPNGLFQNLTRLESVHLNHNQIRQVERFSFKNTPSLSNIALFNNKIEFINVSFKDNFDNLTQLYLFGNPWKCDCKLGPLYELLKKKYILNPFGIVCEKPPTLHGRIWRNISRDEFVCSPEDAISTRDSVMTSTEPTISTELLVTNGTILKLDNDQGIIKDAEPVHIEETSTIFETRKTVTDESSDKSVSKRKPETRIEISDITQRPVIIDEKQVVAVDEESNSSETSELDSVEFDTEAEDSIITEELTPTIESTKTPREPVDDQIVTTTTDILFNSHERADTNVRQVSNDLKWLPWTLFSVAIVCLLGCAARYTFTRYRRRIMPSVRRTEQTTEETSELIYIHTAQQTNC